MGTEGREFRVFLHFQICHYTTDTGNEQTAQLLLHEQALPLLTPFPSCWLKYHFIKSKTTAKLSHNMF